METKAGDDKGWAPSTYIKLHNPDSSNASSSNEKDKLTQTVTVHAHTNRALSPLQRGAADVARPVIPPRSSPLLQKKRAEISPCRKEEKPSRPATPPRTPVQSGKNSALKVNTNQTSGVTKESGSDGPTPPNKAMGVSSINQPNLSVSELRQILTKRITSSK